MMAVLFTTQPAGTSHILTFSNMFLNYFVKMGQLRQIRKEYT